eukprot:COSAG01_NODE_3621_length_5860_cov_4.719840_4_plen_327_part_00
MWSRYSCNQMENAHLHAPRVLAMFGLGWQQLDLSVLRLYNSTLPADGYVPSLFGGGCNGHGKLDVGERGRLRGDDNSLFILDAFAYHHSVPGGAKAMHGIWPAIQRAAEWNFKQAAQHGTIQSRTLINTFDGIPREGDVCTYTSLLYIASLSALEQLAIAHSNYTLAARCRASKALALAAVNRLLWTGTHYRGFACVGRGIADSNIQGALRASRLPPARCCDQRSKTHKGPQLGPVALRLHLLVQVIRCTVSCGPQSLGLTPASRPQTCALTSPLRGPGRPRRMGCACSQTERPITTARSSQGESQICRAIWCVSDRSPLHTIHFV